MRTVNFAIPAILAVALGACSGGHDRPAGSPAAVPGSGLPPVEQPTIPPPTNEPTPPPPPAGPPATCAGFTQPADVTVTVDAMKGPAGAAQPVMNRRFYSMNIADWMPQDYTPQLNDAFAAYLKALHPGLLRWPAGHSSQQHIWSRTATAPTNLTPAMVDAFVGMCQAVGAQPYIAVNLKTGTPEQAADLVRYVNVEKKYKVTFWQMGNEPDNLDGLTKDAAQYAAQYKTFSAAMRAVDKSIKLVGAELMTGAHVVGSNGQTNWLTPILQQDGADMDAIAWHYYPLDSGNPNPDSSASSSAIHLLQEHATDWLPSGMDFADSAFPMLRAARDAMAPKAELWVDEFAEDSGAKSGAGLSDEMAGALWSADALGRFAEQGVSGMFHFLFHSVAAHKLALLDENLQPRPEYYTYWLYAQHFGDRPVDSKSTNPRFVAAHAATRMSDGTLRLVLVNKMGVPKNTTVQLANFVPKSATQFVLTGKSMNDTSPLINGQKLNATLVSQDGKAITPMPGPGCAQANIVVPAFSVMLVAFSPN